MTTTINADTVTGGAIITGDASGELGLQTAGTTRMTFSGATINIPTAAARITGDFSNATLANRVWFQSSTTNGDTNIYAVPNGTSTISGYAVFNASTLTNAGYYNLSVTSTDARLDSGRFGTGTYLPMTFYTGGSERVRIDTSGNVGIGTNAPSALLQVNKSDASTTIGGSAAKIVVQNSNGGALNQTSGIEFNVGNLLLSQSRLAGVYGLYEAFNATALGGALVFATNSAGSTTISERARITSGGEVYIAGTTDQGAYNLQVNGTGVWGAGAYVNGSDARIKDNITPLQSGLDVVAKLKPVTFQYKETWDKDTSVQPGFIAQDLQEALADTGYVDGVVKQGAEYLNVSYQTLIPLLTKAIQELKAEIDALKGAKA